MAPPHRDVWLCSSARTTSNLVVQLLSDQPEWVQKEYHFHPTFLWGRMQFEGTPIADITPEQHAEYVKRLREGWERLQKERDEAHEAGKSCFFKNHTMSTFDPSALSQEIYGGEKAPAMTLSDNEPPKTNPTLFSDDFCRTWTPVFLIRHPAQMVESFYRAEARVRPVALDRKENQTYISLGYSRQLYDWYINNSDIKPIVLEADDILEEGPSMTRMCELVGMDPARLVHSWAAKEVKDTDVNPFLKSYMEGLWQSTGIDKSKMSKGLTVDGKYLQWKNELGDETADKLRDMVDKAMDDYQYLYARKL